MKNTNSSNTFEEKPRKITLKGYYQSLPSRSAPKSEFINEIVRRCNVTEQTVRNWILYDVRPQQHDHIKILSEETGIKEENLWKG